MSQKSKFVELKFKQESGKKQNRLASGPKNALTERNTMKLLSLILLISTIAVAQHTPPTTPDLTVAQCQADAKLWASDAYDIRIAPMKTLLAQQKEVTVCRTQVDKANTGLDYINASHRVNLAFFTRTEHYLSRHYGDNWRTQFFFEDNQGKR